MITTVGEYLLRLSTPNHEKMQQIKNFDAAFGGAEANVVASLSLLGNKTQFITALPSNLVGDSALLSLSKFKIDTRFIQRNKHRMGVYFLETGNGFRNSTVIYDRENSAMSNIEIENFDWEKALENTTWLHWSGITPAISQNAARFLEIGLEIAHNKGITISVDLNFREKLWKYGKNPSDIMPNLLQYCHIIFGGIDAPEKIFGITPKGKSTTKIKLSDDDILSVSQQLLKQYCPNAQLFSTTLRQIFTNSHHSLQGIIIENDTLTKSNLYDMPNMLDRVGGGDAFMAGLIHGLIHFNSNNQKIADFAAAASVLKHYTIGDINFANTSDIEALANGNALAISR